ncbi:hypothetical protein ColLi_07686 [Colletotrichum liriopes]|uniref:Uncharacterized protein n=1 Tax=Colletotrichum liriopes TaxID=708192 RepID=A0AA37GRG9_9PEZI|nr:hypothetical protein ColLi_07686 [Colletotrichum liriopes]
MSHFIHGNNVIKALFKRYQDHNIEYAACGLLQNLLFLGFPINEGYANTFEQPPDQGGTRMDVLTLNLRNNRLVPTMIFEVKGGGKAAAEAERQVLGYALAAIRHHRLAGIYVCTFIGKERDILFACWVVDATDRILQPADHSPARYTSLGSDTEHRLWLFWGHVKSHLDQPQPMPPPQIQAPNQYVYDPSQYVYGDDEDIYDAPSADTYNQPSVYTQDPLLRNQPTQGQLGGQDTLPREFTGGKSTEGPTVDDSEAEEEEDEGTEDDEPGPSAAGPSQAYSSEHNQPESEQVKIRRVAHMLHATEYTFKKKGKDGKKGKKVTTKKEHWRRVLTQTRGLEVWYFKKNEKYWGYMHTD